MVEFLDKLSRVLDRRNAVNRIPEILSVLMQGGGYTVQSVSDDRPLFEALERQGIIERSDGYSRMPNGLRRYILSEDYRDICNIICGSN